MLTLALLRHAKSSWSHPELNDFARPLNARGEAAAPLIGRTLASVGLKPDVILCSSAERTRATLAGLATACPLGDAPVSYEDELYLASPDVLLGRLQKLAPEVTSALLIGHNPGLEELAHMLVKTGDARSIIAMEHKFPTGALAVFTLPATKFADIGPEIGRLEHFITPRGQA